MQTNYPDKQIANRAGVDLVCYNSFEQVESLKQQWDSIVERTGGALCSSFDWCQIWWNHFSKGRQLEIYVATVADKIVAVLPLFRETIHWGSFSLRVIRLVGSDHLAASHTLAVEDEWMMPVAQALIEQLNRNGKWDLIRFGELAGYCDNAEAFAEFLRKSAPADKVIFTNDDYPHMVFEIPGGFEEFLATLSGKERHNVRRDVRFFGTNVSVTYNQPKSREDFDAALDRLIELHTEQWNSCGEVGNFVKWPGVADFYREMGSRLLESGRLVLIEIYRNNKLAVSEYGLRFGSNLLWLINGRAPDVVSSRVGFYAVLQAAVDAGVKRIDSLAGHFDYKRRLGASKIGVKNITVINHQPGSHRRLKAVRFIVRLMDIIYFRIWFWRLVPWIRRQFPSLHSTCLNHGFWIKYMRSRFLLSTAQAGESF